MNRLLKSRIVPAGRRLGGFYDLPSMRMERSAANEAGTEALAKAIAPVLRPGDVVAIQGPLGAGKTTLVRALATALGAEPSMVSSPTFVIVNEYPAGGAAIVHADAYRLNDAAELEGTGWDRLTGGEIVFVEWAMRVREALPTASLWITIEPTGEHSRRFELDIPETWRDRPGLDRLARSDTKCPITGQRVDAMSPTWPFASEKARMADLHRWFSGGYSIGRPVTPED